MEFKENFWFLISIVVKLYIYIYEERNWTNMKGQNSLFYIF